MRSKTAALLKRLKALAQKGFVVNTSSVSTAPPSLGVSVFSSPLQQLVITSPPSTRASLHCTLSFRESTLKIHNKGLDSLKRFVATNSAGADVAQKILSADTSQQFNAIVPLLHSLDPAGLPAVARAAAVTGATDPAFRDALVSAAVRGLSSLAPADLCSVVESLADLGAYSVPFKDATATQVLARLDEFSGDMLGHTLRAFGSMEYYDDDLLEGVVSHMNENPEKFSAENVADVVYALSQSNFCHPDLVTIVQRAGELLLKEAEHDRGEAISSIVDAYSRVGCSDPEVVDQLVARVAARPQNLGGEALSKLVTATIRLGCENEKMLFQLIDGLVDKLDETEAQDIVDMVAALGELGLRHKQLLNTLTDRVIPERLSEFHSVGLNELVDSLNKLGYYNQELMSMLAAKE